MLSHQALEDRKLTAGPGKAGAGAHGLEVLGVKLAWPPDQQPGLHLLPRVSSAAASTVAWPTPAPASRTAPSTAPAGTDASTAACRNAWPWACPETVRPSGQPPSFPCSPEGPPGLCTRPSRGPFSTPPDRPCLLRCPLWGEQDTLIGALPSPQFQAGLEQPSFPCAPQLPLFFSSGWVLLPPLPSLPPAPLP